MTVYSLWFWHQYHLPKALLPTAVRLKCVSSKPFLTIIFEGIKPFVEVSIVQLLIKNSQIRQFKYFKVLVQEFHIKVDLGFVNAVVDMMQQSDNSDEEDVSLNTPVSRSGLAKLVIAETTLCQRHALGGRASVRARIQSSLARSEKLLRLAAFLSFEDSRVLLVGCWIICWSKCIHAQLPQRSPAGCGGNLD